ncbi:MAG: hypothetical protein V3U60_16445 [Gammaproteobacteria bacterium]
MGCDIHGVLERKVDGKWITSDTLSSHHAANRQKDASVNGWSLPAPLDRNYDRFAALAGVRGDGPPARGLPDDLSETATLLADHWEANGHSHSWLPLPEAVQIMADTEFWRENEGPDRFVRKYPEDFFFGVDKKNLSEYRFVFWFDN